MPPFLFPYAAFALASASLASAASSSSSTSLPKVDFSSMGTVAVIGSFSGLSLYDPQNPPIAFDAAASTLLARAPNGQMQQLGATDEGGSIGAICQSEDGAAVFVGGNFTSVGGVPARNIAAYDPSAKAFSALGAGINGEVRALSCNGSSVYAGGDFPAPEGSDGGPNVAMWSVPDKRWEALPFYGLDGAVESISVSEDGKSLFVGGAFSTLFSNSSSSLSTSSSSSSAGTGIPSLGSSLTPISLNASDYWASPTTWTSGFGRPEYIFCPSREDGIGASWLLVDGQNGFFIARMYRQLNVRGIRLGNTFYEGRGTKNFSVVSIPDDQVLTLSYNSNPSDPSSPLLTCSDNCPLAHNSSLPYQDFLFPPGTTLTGFQLNIFGWYGAGGGLHLLQLLSEGSYAYAVAADNTSPCAAGLGASTQASVSTTGEWTTANVSTATAGTTQSVLVASVAGGTSPDSAPSVTWKPVVTQDGNYAVYMVTPGCTADGTCSSRTTVSVTATPQGGSANTTTVDQRVQETTSTLIFNGTLVAGSDSLSVSMTLAQGGAPQSGREYQLVANYINLVASSTRGSSALQRGHGVFEFPLVDTGAFGDAVPTAQATGVNASATLSNATAFDALGFSMGAEASVAAILSVGTGDAARVFVGGEFAYSAEGQEAANVLAYGPSGAIITPNGGLDGPVTALAVLDGALFAAGTFTATADSAVAGLEGLARWNYTASGGAWEKVADIPAGLQGQVAQLGALPPQQGEKGANASLVAVGGGGSGLAFLSPTSGWNSTQAGFFLGNLSSLSTPPLDTQQKNQTTYLAGNVRAYSRNRAPGGAVISSGKNGKPRLQSFGFGFSDSTTTASSTATAARSKERRSETSAVRSLVDRRDGMSKRYLEARAPSAPSSVNLTLPSPLQAAAATTAEGDEVLAGAFWSNGSSSNEVMLLGGRFSASPSSTTSNSSPAVNATIRNLAAYDTSSQVLSALPGQGLEIDGTVTVLRVFDDQLWVGGNFTTGSGRQGMSTYDLKEGRVGEGEPPLASYSGTNATVSVIAQRPGYDEQILVAGAFSYAGSLFCQSVCLWDSVKLQWSALATGLQGVVGSIDFAGSKSEYLLAAGSFVLDDETRYIARWNFKNSSWSGIGAAIDLPGPATAVSADDNNKDKIFVAGASATTNAPYLLYWNGTAWSDVNNNTLASGSGVQSLAFVPLQSSHPSNDVIESNRMLLVSGALTINDTDVAAALYDGESWYPYLLATGATGSAGIVSQLFSSVTDFSLSGKHHLSPGLVILVSIAIGLGVVFLLVLAGLLIALARRKDEPQQQYPPPSARYGQGGNGSEASSLHRPTSLLQTVGAATAVLLDPKGEKAAQRHAAGVGAAGHGGDGDSIAGPLSFDGAAMSYGSDYGEDDAPSAALARYSFHAEHPGELSISSQEQLTVLDGTDGNWWMVLNHAGQRGLVPVAYLC
ncbi:hypothetical protein JCM10213_007377 [Rhodosporidiobolus nylandii]